MTTRNTTVTAAKIMAYAERVRAVTDDELRYEVGQEVADLALCAIAQGAEDPVSIATAALSAQTRDHDELTGWLHPDQIEVHIIVLDAFARSAEIYAGIEPAPE